MNDSDKKKKINCHGCSNGCRLIVLEDEYGVQVFGNHCRKGEIIGKESYRDRMPAVFCGRVRVRGRLRRRRVCTSAPVEADRHSELRALIKSMEIDPETTPGQILAADILGLGVDLLCDQVK